MDQLSAMRATLELSESAWKSSNVRCHELSYEHALDMLKRVLDDPSKFSSSKLGRWLGWMQCAATAAGALSLEDCKNINKRFA